MISPAQALVFVLFFLILQQIEGNLIYPKVVGGKIGLPSIWVLVGVIAGGALGGVFGMLIGVPVLSVVYALLKEYVNTPKSEKVVVKEVVELI
jgi:predicted PurR-regulated permease PerM